MSDVERQNSMLGKGDGEVMIARWSACSSAIARVVSCGFLDILASRI